MAWKATLPLRRRGKPAAPEWVRTEREAADSG
jgi:hypothetical protein